MHKSHSILRAFSLRRLLVAGTVASLGLPLGRQACGIGGSAIQPTYTPRETISANPSINLIPTAVIAATSVASDGSDSTTPSDGSMPQTRHVTSDDEGHGTTKKRRRQKTSEQDGDTRVAQGPSGAKESKDYGTSKEVKNAIIAPPAKPLITLSTGFESRYIYHGVDIVGFNGASSFSSFFRGQPGPDLRTFDELEARQFKANLTSPIGYINGSFEFKGFQFSVGYINATDHTVPTRVGAENEANTLDRYYSTLTYQLPGSPSKNFPFSPNTPYNETAKLYKEVDINLDYTLGIIAHVLDATVGYNSFIIPDHDFKGTNYQGEALFRLTYKQIPYIQPNISYYRYISDARATEVIFVGQNYPKAPSGLTPAQLLAFRQTYESEGPGFVTREAGHYLDGNYVEARIDSAILLFKRGGLEASFNPYVLASLNDGYLTKQSERGSTTELNTFETGFKLPVTIAEHFSVIPYFNYGVDISRTHVANDFSGTLAPFKEDVWGGVTFSYHF